MSYLTTPTSFITVDGTKIAYRELSPGASRLPLVMLVHLAANLDNWDPRLVDQLANDRHLILLDLPGVGASGGTVPPTLEEAGEQAARIVRGLGHDRVDLLGLSMGGMIAQEVVRHDPELVERLILVGTGPRAGLGIDKVTPTTFRHMFRAALKRKDPKRYIFYTRDAHGEAVANEVLGRLGSRTAQYADKAVTVPSFLRQLRAISRSERLPRGHRGEQLRASGATRTTSRERAPPAANHGDSNATAALAGTLVGTRVDFNESPGRLVAPFGTR